MSEIVIEEGVDVSDNIKSLKYLAPGFRTYKKLSKQDILLDWEKTKIIIRRKFHRDKREANDKIINDAVNKNLQDLVKRSTKEMLEHLNRANREVLESNDSLKKYLEKYLVSVSADVTALYVEIRPDRAGEEIYEGICEGDWTFEADPTEMGIYIATNWLREKIVKHSLSKVIPFRTRNNKINPNSRLTMLSDELNRPLGKVSDGKWTTINPNEYNELTVKKLVTATISISLEACLTNHCFEQQTQRYLQPFQGVIGLDLMGCLADIYMLRWILKLIAKLKYLSQLPIPVVNDEANKNASEIINSVINKAEGIIESHTIIDDMISSATKPNLLVINVGNSVVIKVPL